MPDYAHELAESYINGNRKHVLNELFELQSPALLIEVYRTLDNNGMAASFTAAIHLEEDRRDNQY